MPNTLMNFSCGHPWSPLDLHKCRPISGRSHGLLHLKPSRASTNSSTGQASWSRGASEVVSKASGLISLWLLCYIICFCLLASKQNWQVVKTLQYQTPNAHLKTREFFMGLKCEAMMTNLSKEPCLGNIPRHRRPNHVNLVVLWTNHSENSNFAIAEPKIYV